ncbi:hypothetical protein A176_001640 [Myxococcus hansupus]|uniref:Uncharacterized protein n=1 Tax=Pseudomyxococcus hansupus TaxID=1297742 RepID=A0A0H4WT44_9BACT|nr:hypothetical protein A176_001640 [Myxococcus hansupus]
MSQRVVTFSHTAVTVSYDSANDLFTVRDTANAAVARPSRAR